MREHKRTSPIIPLFVYDWIAGACFRNVTIEFHKSTIKYFGVQNFSNLTLWLHNIICVSLASSDR